MVRPIDLISTDPDQERLSIPRLSLKRYNNIVQEHLASIDEAKQALMHIGLFFKDEGTILPATCKEATRTLSKLRERIEELSQLLDETSHLPLVHTILRYDLLHMCSQIKTRISKLEDLIDSYRLVCLSPAPYAQRRRIADAFETLFDLISEMFQLVKFQSQTARFQEQKLISAYEQARKTY